jgi:hypothetical protein
MSSEPPLTYFTCTLGQAAEQNKDLPRDFETVTQFIDRQARVHPDKPAVAFPLPASEKKEEWGCNVLCEFCILYEDVQVWMLTLTSHSIQGSEERFCWSGELAERTRGGEYIE